MSDKVDHTEGQVHIKADTPTMIRAVGGGTIAHTEESFHGIRNPAVSVANAARLVLCWNCYDDLVDTCKELCRQNEAARAKIIRL